MSQLFTTRRTDQKRDFAIKEFKNLGFRLLLRTESLHFLESSQAAFSDGFQTLQLPTDTASIAFVKYNRFLGLGSTLPQSGPDSSKNASE